MPLDEQLFPAGLFKLAGYADGGVKTPFQDASGRPTGRVVRTPVVQRVERWTRALANNEPGTPQALFLVGGPGNGKSDAVEFFIDTLDALLGAGGELVAQAKVGFSGMPPRTVALDLRKSNCERPLYGKAHIKIVQDASAEGDGSEMKSSAELLLEDLRKIANDRGDTIFFTCVNRGIIASALAHAAAQGDTIASEILQDIAVAVSFGQDTKACWPLESDKRIAVWPMDVESLLERSGDSDAAVGAILDFALADDRWTSSCAAGDLCPFHTNKRLLCRPGNRDALIKAIRYHEVSAGRRWTFRDLMALTATLLVGDEADYVHNGRRITPCEWAELQVRKAQNHSDRQKQVKASLELIHKHYAMTLYSRWPSLRSERGRLLRGLKSALGENYDLVDGLFSFLWTYKPIVSTSVARALVDEVGPLLDPVEARGDAVLSGDVSINKLEEGISFSLIQGFSLVEKNLEPIERHVIDLLKEIERVLNEGNFKRGDLRKADELREIVKIFSARLLKRLLSARSGVTRDSSYLDSYLDAIGNNKSLSDTVRLFLKVLNDDEHYFCASLLTTFGQPTPARERDIVLRVSRLKAVPRPRVDDERRPHDPVPKIEVQGERIPVTYPLFRALSDVDAGLDPASLPDEIRALLEGVRARVAGRLARDQDFLSDSAKIEFGERGIVVAVDYDQSLMREH